MSNYRREFVPGGRWFFTANLLRQPLLVDHIATFHEAYRVEAESEEAAN